MQQGWHVLLDSANHIAKHPTGIRVADELAFLHTMENNILDTQSLFGIKKPHPCGWGYGVQWDFLHRNDVGGLKAFRTVFD